jgi:hypothetical protein
LFYYLLSGNGEPAPFPERQVLELWFTGYWPVLASGGSRPAPAYSTWDGNRAAGVQRCAIHTARPDGKQWKQH